MKTTIKTFVITAATALLAIGSAGAKSVPAQITIDSADTYGNCSTGNRSSYRSGSRSNYRSGYTSSGYRSSNHSSYRSQHVSYRTRCRVIGRSYYYMRGCRYCRVTYLNERVDNCGRVVSSWRSCKTIRA